MLSGLLDELNRGPTILGLSEILGVMDTLQSIDEVDIVNDGDAFLEILDMLVESYSDAAIFEVDDDSRPLIDAFNGWLVRLGARRPLGREQDNLLAYANTFSKTLR